MIAPVQTASPATTTTSNDVLDPIRHGRGRRQGSRQAELARDAFDAVRRVDVLDQGDLVACGGALAGDDGRVGEEEFPYL